MFYKKVKHFKALFSVLTDHMETLFPTRSFSKSFEIRICNTIILPVVLYDCQTCTVILIEERMIFIFGNRIMRLIFGLKREWRRFHYDGLQNLYGSPNKISEIKYTLSWAGHIVTIKE